MGRCHGRYLRYQAPPTLANARESAGAVVDERLQIDGGTPRSLLPMAVARGWARGKIGPTRVSAVRRGKRFCIAVQVCRPSHHRSKHLLLQSCTLVLICSPKHYAKHRMHDISKNLTCCHQVRDPAHDGKALLCLTEKDPAFCPDVSPVGKRKRHANVLGVNILTLTSCS